MASGIYNQLKYDLMVKATDLVNDTINCALYDNSHAFTATDTTYTTTHELATAGNYTQGGKALTTKAVTKAATTYWSADNVSWTAATFTAYHAVLYDASVSNHLIASIDFGGAQAVVAGNFTIQWNASGIITLT